MPITNIQLTTELPRALIEGGSGTAAPGFSEQFEGFLKGINSEMQQAEKMSEAFAAGEVNNIHETMIAAEKAMLAFKMAGTLRNRVIEAYREVMRMPL